MPVILIISQYSVLLTSVFLDFVLDFYVQFKSQIPYVETTSSEGKSMRNIETSIASQSPVSIHFPAHFLAGNFASDFFHQSCPYYLLAYCKNDLSEAKVVSLFNN